MTVCRAAAVSRLRPGGGWSRSSPRPWVVLRPRAGGRFSRSSPRPCDEDGLDLLGHGLLDLGVLRELP
ncbi:hypothetical protein ABZ930_36600, partial [Streptomyces sp. NPDC046716]|uniref:hypothetical protein n=1 Tax=Streptomyces sp. NPDC046716 TaxID=3157093 RepID=UPI0033F7BAF8